MVKMIVFYTIPFILLSVLLVWNSTHTTRNIQDSFITNMSHAFDQSYRDIEGRIQVASDLTSMVSRNNKMLEFINDPYLGDQSEFLKEYLDTVTPIIKYATAFSESDDYSIRVYMGNDAIPESWPYFFHLSNYSSHPKLQQFMQKDSETRLWLLPDDRELGPASLHDERRKYTLLTKLYSPARDMLGLAVVTLAEDSLFSIEEEPANLSNAQFLYAAWAILDCLPQSWTKQRKQPSCSSISAISELILSMENIYICIVTSIPSARAWCTRCRWSSSMPLSAKMCGIRSC